MKRAGACITFRKSSSRAPLMNKSYAGLIIVGSSINSHSCRHVLSCNLFGGLSCVSLPLFPSTAKDSLRVSTSCS